jgi:hypothetical protein
MAGHDEDETKEPMELFVHRPGTERVILRVVEPTVTVAEAVTLADGERVWLEETEDELDVTMTVAEARIPHRGHVHVNRCPRAATTVTYNGEEKQRTFRSSARIERVFEWAVSKRGFNLTPTDAAEHALQVAGTTTQPDPGDQVGSFVDAHCAVTFSLVAKIRNEG